MWGLLRRWSTISCCSLLGENIPYFLDALVFQVYLLFYFAILKLTWTAAMRQVLVESSLESLPTFTCIRDKAKMQQGTPIKQRRIRWNHWSKCTWSPLLTTSSTPSTSPEMQSSHREGGGLSFSRSSFRDISAEKPHGKYDATDVRKCHNIDLDKDVWGRDSIK